MFCRINAVIGHFIFSTRREGYKGHGSCRFKATTQTEIGGRVLGISQKCSEMDTIQSYNQIHILNIIPTKWNKIEEMLTIKFQQNVAKLYRNNIKEQHIRFVSPRVIHVVGYIKLQRKFLKHHISIQQLLLHLDYLVLHFAG